MIVRYFVVSGKIIEKLCADGRIAPAIFQGPPRPWKITNIRYYLETRTYKIYVKISFISIRPFARYDRRVMRWKAGRSRFGIFVFVCRDIAQTISESPRRQSWLRPPRRLPWYIFSSPQRPLPCRHQRSPQCPRCGCFDCFLRVNTCLYFLNKYRN